MAVVTQFPTANELGSGGTVNWTNPNNAHADDGVNATVGAVTDATTRWKTFGFDAVIPAGSVIDAVQVIIEHSEVMVGSINSWPQVGGVDQTFRAFPNRVALTVDTNDHTADRAWTRADLLDANFKVNVTATTDVAESALMDYVKVEVTYHAPLAYESAVSADNPILYWRTGETSGSTANDYTSNGRSGTYVGNPILGVAGALTADSNTAVALNGSSQYITRAAEDALDFAGNLPFSLEIWFKPNVVDTTFRRPISHKPATADGYGMFYHSTQGIRWERTAPTGTNIVVISGVIPIPGRWYHVVGTYDGSNMRIYVNGILSGGPSAAAGAAVDVTISFDVGRSSTGGNFVDGTVDEVAVYDFELSATRVQAHYDTGVQLGYLTPPAAPLTITGIVPTVIGPPAGKIFRETGTDYYLLEDASGVYLLEGIAGSGGTTLSPAAAALLLSGLIPRLDLILSPSVASLVLAGIAPVLGFKITPTIASLLLSAAAPTVTLNSIITPAIASLVLATMAPQLQEKLSPSIATLTLTGQISNANVGTNVQPAIATLTLSGATSTVTATANVNVSPAVTALTLTGIAPRLDFVITPTIAALVLSAATSTVTVNNIVTPSIAALILATFAVQLQLKVTPAIATLTLSGQTPTANIGVNVQPIAATLTLSGATSTVTATANVNLSPAPRALVTSTFTARLDMSIPVAPRALVTATFAPSVTATTNYLAAPSPAALALTMSTPFVIGGVTSAQAHAAVASVTFAKTAIAQVTAAHSYIATVNLLPHFAIASITDANLYIGVATTGHFAVADAI